MKALSKNYEAIFSLFARVLLATIFILSGISKIQNYSGTEAYMDPMGAPSITLPLVILFEILGGLMLIVGFKTKIIALLLGGFCLVTALTFHFNLQDQNQFIHFFKNLAMAGGFFSIVATGGLGLSIDKKLSKEAIET